MYANFKKKFKGVAYRKLFWRAAKATTMQRFEGIMKEIRVIDIQTYDHLMERDPKSWSRAFLYWTGLVMPLRMVFVNLLMLQLCMLGKSRL